MDLTGVGRLLIFVGAAIVLVGLVFLVANRVPFVGWLGRLPGDFVFRRGETTIYIPLMTSIVVSIVLTLVLTLIFRR